MPTQTLKSSPASRPKRSPRNALEQLIAESPLTYEALGKKLGLTKTGFFKAQQAGLSPERADKLERVIQAFGYELMHFRIPDSMRRRKTAA